MSNNAVLKENINNVLEKLNSKNKNKLNMVIGLDGFIDEVIHVVETRENPDEYKRLETIEAFGNRIIKASGLSTNIEFVSKQIKLGGNGPNLTVALLNYGVDITYIGCIGDNGVVDPVFKPLSDRCKEVHLLCSPGHTDAVEFIDGKLMLGKITVLNTLTWNKFKDVVGGVENIASIFKNTQLLGIQNWTMVPQMSNIWEGIITEVFPLLPNWNKEERPYVFFDLCDPEKKTKADIVHAMGLIGKFEDKFKTILGLNEKELYEITTAFDIEVDSNLTQDEKHKFAIKSVYEKLGIHCLVVHPTKEAFCYLDGKYYQSSGPYCAKPVLTTGAGDNFNGGFCFAQALGLNPIDSLLLGVSTSGYYVRNGASPNFNELIAFLNEWKNEV